jgi:hypothetical protein
VLRALRGGVSFEGVIINLNLNINLKINLNICKNASLTLGKVCFKEVMSCLTIV